ncbi:hypothetical protein BBJ28_00020146 [Nothophytophthora sp. Chile5]|nr:hypothetical protein BBJ28_00020146 [Nothophytophthora sp. Chile5]
MPGGLKGGFYTPASAFGRKLADRLQRKKLVTFDLKDLLQRYWTASFRNKRPVPPFALVNDLWSLEGGFSDANPAADLHPTGELGLQCLVFFVETYPAETAMMRRGRGGYPFAQAAVAITRALSQTLDLVDANGNPGRFPVTDALFWQLFERDTCFYQLFALAFLLFEELFCEEVARNPWMRDADACSTAVVNKLVSVVKLKLAAALKQAPLKLADLQDLCTNGRHIVSEVEETRDNVTVARPTTEGAVAAGNDQTAISRWSQHHTSGRKSMRQIGENWGKQKIPWVNEKGVAYRLKPRMPEIAQPSSDSSQASDTTSSTHQQDQDEELAADVEAEDKNSDPVPSEPERVPAAESTSDLFAGLVTKETTALVDPEQDAAVPEGQLRLARSC